MFETYRVTWEQTMEKAYGRNIVLVLGGYLRPDENRKAWLARIAKTANISVRTAYAAFYQEGISKDTERALQKAAREKARNDHGDVIRELESRIALWERVDEAFHRPHIDAARAVIAQLCRDSDNPLWAVVPAWNDDDPGT